MARKEECGIPQKDCISRSRCTQVEADTLGTIRPEIKLRRLSIPEMAGNLVELLFLVASHLAIKLTYGFPYVRSTWLPKSI